MQAFLVQVIFGSTFLGLLGSFSDGFGEVSGVNFNWRKQIG